MHSIAERWPNGPDWWVTWCRFGGSGWFNIGMKEIKPAPDDAIVTCFMCAVERPTP